MSQSENLFNVNILNLKLILDKCILKNCNGSFKDLCSYMKRLPYRKECHVIFQHTLNVTQENFFLTYRFLPAYFALLIFYLWETIDQI